MCSQRAVGLLNVVHALTHLRPVLVHELLLDTFALQDLVLLLLGLLSDVLLGGLG